jgi:MYXO-CTERM domain-containing protein
MHTHRAPNALLVCGAVVVLSAPAWSADMTAGVVSSSLKVRPDDQPTTKASAALEAAKNEFEAFQIVLRAGAADVPNVSAKVSQPLTGPGGRAIPAANVVLYAERYYQVGARSNDEGAPGPWPDPLVPDVDSYFGEKRNAFPVTVTAGKTSVVWVDILVPIDQAAGDYAGEIEIDVGAAKQAAVPVSLHVGTFALPSTATLSSAFGMGWNAAPVAHCGAGAFPYCGGDADKSNAIHALYLRSALEHRFTISDTDFQPPFGGDLSYYETHVVPMIGGTAAVRLPGAKLTNVRLDDGDPNVGRWITYAKSKSFFERLFYYPTDEPGTSAAAWTPFITHSDALHAADAAARIIITSSFQDAQSAGAVDKIDVFVPVLDQLENRPGSGAYAGSQRSKYDAWLTAKPNRAIWAYQSCDQHGCGNCGDTTPGVDYTGWPNRVIDSSGVQDRAFPWQAFLFDVTGELYFETTFQLATAWDANGQCAFGGSGDGTVFYPGTPAKVGGTHDIPIESIRMKMIREGMEDYEYLVLVAKKDAALARSIAIGLFPHTYESAQTPDKLEAARDRMFKLLDSPVTSPEGGAGDAAPVDAAGSGGSTPTDAAGSGGSPRSDAAGSGGSLPASADASPSAEPTADEGGCGCRTGAPPAHGSLMLLLFSLLTLVRRRASK